jgi:4-hydroxybenzoate polyprenyltransferase
MIADAVRGHWVMLLLPSAFVPYAQLMRLERPIGWWLLLLPCWWSLTLAQVAAGGGWPKWQHALLFLIGAIVMRGAGCVINDIADREFDGRVARTQLRPIPSGRVTVKQALVFLAALLLIGLGVLLQFNTITIVTGMASMLIVAVYPFMKRVTYWPQFVLGLAFNWGALVAWTATHGTIGWPALALYVGGIAWTLAYDTIYAHQDKDDDVLIGVKSTALRLGDNSKPWLVGFFGIALVAIGVALVMAQAGAWAFVGLAMAALHAVWQLRMFDANDGDNCLMLFRANRTFGLLILTGLLADTLGS